MSTPPAPSLAQRTRAYSIKEVAALTGLPASTLRYYEQVGVLPPVDRGATSGHRVFAEEDLDRVMGVACMAATGMPLGDMRTYVANTRLGTDGAAAQVALLRQQEERLAREAEQLEVRRRYVRLKTDYWRAVEDGDAARADEVGARARALADELRRG